MYRFFFAFSFFLFFYGSLFSQTEDLNLDFEQVKNNYPAYWENFGSSDYKIYSDSSTVKNGKYSGVIENGPDGSESDFKALSIALPANYQGKEIRLTGYIKTENVTKGYAGLWMRIDPEIGFDNMNDRGATGTSDWKKYEVVLPLEPKKTDKIFVGGLLVGKGKMWIDDLKVTIDGKDLDHKRLKTYERTLLPAEKDNEFDEGSNIVLPNLTKEKIENLELLGRIWGFLKYHHPEIAKGNYNWDYELFRILPDYLKVQNKQERDKTLLAWIDKYGKISPCKKCDAPSKDAVLKPNLSWIEHENLSSRLKQSLHHIYDNRNQGKNFYISLFPNVENPEFTNEKTYVNMPYPDDGFRLLTLYKYWNIIEYYYPNKHLTNKKWDTVLKEYIPQFIQAGDELAYELAALKLIGEVNDTHANLWGGGKKIAERRGNNFAPFRVEFVENKLVVTDYYNPELSGTDKLEIGDVITHINHKSVQSIVDSLKPYYPVSNEASLLRDIAADLMRSPQKTIHLKYNSKNQDKEQEIALYSEGDLDLYQ